MVNMCFSSTKGGSCLRVHACLALTGGSVHYGTQWSPSMIWIDPTTRLKVAI